MPKGNKKGSAFEREICKQLSLWWTNDDRDDIFWRTAGSGARAKVRSKKGKKTFGQAADIQATDPIGQPLIDLCCIELKKGYSKSTFADLIDAPDSAAEQMYSKFISQAKQDASNAGCPYWMLICKRDRREPVIIIPKSLYDDLKNECSIKKCRPKVMLYLSVHSNYFVTILHEFLSRILPEDFLEIHEQFDWCGLTKEI